MKKRKQSDVFTKNDLVHIMGIGMSFYGGAIIHGSAVLQVGALKKMKTGKVAQKDIDNTAGKSYIMFSDVHAIDTLITRLSLMKKALNKKSIKRKSKK